MFRALQRRLKWGGGPSARVAAALFIVCVLSPAQAWAGYGTDPLVEKARAQVDEFVGQYSSMRYEEDVVQQKLDAKGKVLYGRETIYDSMMLIRFADNQPRVDEQRLVNTLPRKGEFRPLLSTSGFSTLVMIFHSYYESSFRFSRLSDDLTSSTPCARIHFEYIPGTPSPSLYQMINMEKPLEWSGIAWINPATGEILRIVADVGSSLENTGMKELRADVSYGPVTLRGTPQPLWLPVSATIDLETARQHFRNVHHYGDYRQYRASGRLGGAAKQ